MDKNIIKNGFVEAVDTYDKHATVQREISDKLFDEIKKCESSSVVELGAGTGYLTKKLKSLNFKEMYINDLMDLEHINLCGDMEEITIPKVDMVVSSNALQWIVNLDNMFKKISDSLSNNGMFIFSTFTEGNLVELNNLIDGLTYLSKENIISLLKKHNFNVIISKETKYKKNFNTLRELFDEFKYTGVKLNQELSHNKLRDFDSTHITYVSSMFVCKKGA